MAVVSPEQCADRLLPASAIWVSQNLYIQKNFIFRFPANSEMWNIVIAPATNPRSGADRGQMYSTVVFGGGCRCPVSKCRVTWCQLAGVSYGRQPASKSTTLLELRRIIPANSMPRLGPAAAASMRTLQQTAWALSTFTPATFSPAGIHKPHASQPDLLLLLLCDLSSPLCGCTEIAVWRCSWWRGPVVIKLFWQAVLHDLKYIYSYSQRF